VDQSRKLVPAGKKLAGVPGVDGFEGLIAVAEAGLALGVEEVVVE